MNTKTKKVLKNVAKTGGKFTLKGLKLAGNGTLSVAEIASKSVSKVAGSNSVRKILAKSGTLLASVAFPGPALSIIAISYLLQHCVLNKSITPVDALKQTLGISERVLKDVLDIASLPTVAISNEVSKVANKGKDALDR